MVCTSLYLVVHLCLLLFDLEGKVVQFICFFGGGLLHRCDVCVIKCFFGLFWFLGFGSFPVKYSSEDTGEAA